MQFHSPLKVWAALLIFCALSAGRAEEKEPEGGEGKKEAVGPQPKEQREFAEKNQKINSLSSRIEESEKQFKELVERKAHEKNAAEKERIIKQMNEVTADRNKAVTEYNKLKTDITLRYPNQGERLDRRYLTQPKKSVEELEGTAGLDELLTRTKKVIEKKFAVFNQAPEGGKAPPPKPVKAEEEPKRLRLEK